MEVVSLSAAGADFEDPNIYEVLEGADAAALDCLSYGVIAMASDGTVVAYNAAESRVSGLRPERVLGYHFFTAVAPCTNNFMVAHRYETEPMLDATIDYVFTLRMTPQRVRLRLLRRPGAQRMYLLVQRV